VGGDRIPPMESGESRSPSQESAIAGGDSSRPSLPLDFGSAVLARLRQRGGGARRYSVRQEIGRGGMGRVLSARDEELHRDVAMKVMREDDGGGAESSSLRSIRLARFLEEAQVTAQLDHPGIVPVHELGLDEQGRVYFTMKLVRGEDLSRVIEHARAGRDGWNETRVVTVLLRVCEAMAYAHAKGVIHRDLKPSNIRVGRFGAVYVMDWGLARVNGRSDERDLRVRELLPQDASELVISDRARQTAGDSPLHTMDGTPIGTPMFMSPEQALGRLAELGPATDVYGLGAILYTLLAGRMPYIEPDATPDGLAIVRQIRAGPPRALHEVAPRATAELAAICEKAMQRDATKRYRDMGELAEELRAYLEQRVVRAHRTGPWSELRLWYRRNRSVALALGLAGVAALAGAAAVAASETRRGAEAALRADALEAGELVREARWVGPIDSGGSARIESWLGAAEALVERRRDVVGELDTERAQLLAAGVAFEARLAPSDEDLQRLREARGWVTEFEDVLAQARRALAGTAQPSDRVSDPAEAVRVLPDEIEMWRERARKLERATRERSTLRGEQEALLQRHRSLERLAFDVEQLEAELPSLRQRLTEARGLRERSASGAAAATWDAALASILDPLACPAYAGRIHKLEPVEGLVPLRRNAHSGLWEFHHLASGARPSLDASGTWAMDADTGIVLVLVPGGTALVGAQAADSQAPRHDPDASRTEAPWSVELAPYFLAAHELTQGQWLRLGGECASLCAAGRQLNPDPRATRAHPIESSSARDCEQLLALHGLSLPTEAQWEHAARGGSELRYVFGAESSALEGCANARREGLDERDRYARTAPVGQLAPNGFGLHDVLGNVGEWCADAISDSQDRLTIRPSDGLREPQRPRDRVVRGGSYDSTPEQLRASARRGVHPSNADRFVGVRPSRKLP